MEITRRDWDQLLMRVGRVESKAAQLDSRLKAIETMLKPENLLRRIKNAEEEEKAKAEKEDIFKTNN